jgi:hypothetical protein
MPLTVERTPQPLIDSRTKRLLWADWTPERPELLIHARAPYRPTTNQDTPAAMRHLSKRSR